MGGRISEHSPEVSYYLAKAREAIREASAEIHKREVRETPEPAARAEGDADA